MGKVVVVNNLTLDGVMQAPGRSDEDTRGSFSHGGWSIPYGDEVLGQFMGDRMGQGDGGAILLGRRTYEDFANVWPGRTDNPFSEVLDNTTKYVASSTLTEPLPWQNSILLPAPAKDAVANLRSGLPGDLVVLGSGVLTQSLQRRRLIDEFILVIYPLLLGHGRRMFATDDQRSELTLVDSVTTTKGVIIATYRPSDDD